MPRGGASPAAGSAVVAVINAISLSSPPHPSQLNGLTSYTFSDMVVLYGGAIAQRIKGSPGITGLYRPRVHIDGGVWHLDVDSSHPVAVAGSKGMAVRHLKWYASWV